MNLHVLTYTSPEDPAKDSPQCRSGRTEGVDTRGPRVILVPCDTEMPLELTRLRSGFVSVFGSIESDMFERKMEEGIGALRYHVQIRPMSRPLRGR